MPATCQVVTFAKGTGANGSTQDVSITGTAKALILFSCNTTSDNSLDNEYSQTIGFSDGTNHAAIATHSDDGSAAADTGRIHSNADVFIKLNQSAPTTTVDCRGSVAFQSNNLRFTWTVNDAVATRITCYVFTGSDFTGVKVNTVSINETVDGNTEDYTGLGFTPTGNGKSVVFLMGINHTSNSSSSPTTTAISMLGCATTALSSAATGNQWYLSNVSENTADPSDTWRVTGNDRNYAILDTAGAFDHYGFLNAWISDGFRMKWDNAPASSTVKMSYLVINGGTWDSGTLTTPSVATNNVDKSVVAGGTPIRGLLLTGNFNITSASVSTTSIYSIGVTDGTTHAVHGSIDEDNVATMDGYRFSQTTGVHYIMSVDGVLIERATFDSFTTNNFRLDYPTISGASLLNWVIVSDLAFERGITESSISVSDTLAKVPTWVRPISDSAISCSDTISRTLTANRTLSESSISVSDTVARQLTANRTLSESSISVSETLARMLTANRTLSESAISVSDDVSRLRTVPVAINESVISVSDDLARLFTANRSINEDVDVSDTVEGHKIVITTINEDPISVSDTLARLLTANRSIDEDVDVFDTLARLLTANRSISESGIDVSPDTVEQIKTIVREISEDVDVFDTLARLLTANRSISESAISVSDILAGIKTQIRSISESSISVSDTVAAALTLVTRTISESAISVSDTLARMLTAFRTISEDPISVSDTGSDGVQFFPTLAEFITDTAYTNPVRFRITWKSKKGDTTADESGDQIIYYQYDSWNFQERPFNITNFSIRLTQGEISTASCTIEDHNELIDDPNKIGKKSVVEVDFKKELGRDWERILTGYVRSVKTLRPAYRALGYQITIKSKQVIYNERVVDFKRAAKRSSVDSTNAVVTDSRMLANNLFRELHTATDIFPRRNSPTLQQTGDFDLDTGTISEEVVDFITEIAPGLTTAAEVANQLTEGIGAIWGVDVYGNPYIRYPSEKHSGIIITDSPSDTDSAVNISVNMASFEFESTIDAAEGHANRLYVLNSKDTKVMEDDSGNKASSNKAQGFTTLTTRWLAQSFIAIEPNVTGAAFILSKTGNPTNANGTIKGNLRASSPSGRFPTGSTLATFEISFSQLSNTKDTIFVNDIKTKEGVINIGAKYWWVLQGTGLHDDSNTVNWHHDNDLVTAGRPFSSRGPQVDTDPTKPGTQFTWVTSEVGPVYAFSTFSSINHVLVQGDSESIGENGLIESIVNLPAFNTDADYQKVLVKLLRDSAKEKRIFDLTKITIPTGRLFRPGELVTIIDSKANLDREKQINAEIVEVTYNFDVNNNALGCKYCDLRCVGFIDTIVDNYLENREC